MFAEMRSHLLLMGLSLLLCCVMYPIALLLFGRTLVPESAAGSLIVGSDGRPVGSRLVAQGFKSPKYLHPRPSAVGYNAAGSGGSNLAASNPKLRNRVSEHVNGATEPVSADAVTTSGSGLDPHLTKTAARQQAGRIASTRGRTEAEVNTVLDELAFTPLTGEPLVNVLEVNLRLDERLPVQR